MLFDIYIYIDFRYVNILVFFEGTYIWPFFNDKYASIFINSYVWTIFDLHVSFNLHQFLHIIMSCNYSIFDLTFLYVNIYLYSILYLYFFLFNIYYIFIYYTRFLPHSICVLFIFYLGRSLLIYAALNLALFQF